MECLVCGSSQAAFLYRWSLGFEVYQCSDCSLLYTNPVPDAAYLADFYRTFSCREGESYGHMRQWDSVEKCLPVICNAIREYFAIATKIMEGDKLTSFLDVGGGIGLYSKAAQLLGYESHFVDIDDQAVKFARDELRVAHVMQADVQMISQYPNRTFDVVLARHTIEHLRDPGIFVQHLSRLVETGRLLIIETPNASNWEQWAHPSVFGFHWEILGRENPGLSKVRRLATTLTKPLSAATPPKHLYGFNPQNLTNLLERYGFKIRQRIITICGDPVFDPLYYLTTPSRTDFLGKAYRLYETFASPFVKAIGKGSRLILFAQKSKQ